MTDLLLPLRYTRLTLDTGRRVTLVLTADTASWVCGYEVDREGARVAVTDHGVDVDRLHMVDTAAIVRREELRMNLHYGTLERAK